MSKYFVKSAIALFVLSPSVAFAETKDLGAIARSLGSQIYMFGNLTVVLMMVLGFFCLYKIIMTFANREDERAYPMKNVPMYFAGAAVGLGSSMSSDLVQFTLFGKSNDSINDAVFKLGSSSGGSTPPPSSGS